MTVKERGRERAREQSKLHTSVDVPLKIVCQRDDFKFILFFFFHILTINLMILIILLNSTRDDISTIVIGIKT